jgi:hypothetical protein
MSIEAMKLIAELCADKVLNKKEETILRQAIEQAQKQEPVAWATREDFYRELDRTVNRMRQQMEIKGVVMRCADYDVALPIIDIREGHFLVGQVTSPPQRQPLTDEQIRQVMQSLGWTGEAPSDIEFARAIEAAHGITGEQKCVSPSASPYRTAR